VASNKGGVGKTSYFLALCVDTSKMVRDTTKVAIMTSLIGSCILMRFRLAPKSMTLDDLELL